MKRGREDAEIESTVDMANCLMLLSKVGEGEVTESSPKGRLFACKTCNRTFPSFQALGGHRASHKKPKLLGSDFFRLPNSPPKPKTHECSICGVEFPIGQALGGHMRRHRTNTTTSDELGTRPLLPPAPVLTKSPSSKRVHCLDLDLDLVPEIDLELKLGKVTPALKCFV